MNIKANSKKENYIGLMILGAKNKYNIPEINITSSEYINQWTSF
nr:hypothetical protein [uncultured Methanobacterium sp.]